jgi:outer membrane protein
MSGERRRVPLLQGAVTLGAVWLLLVSAAPAVWSQAVAVGAGRELTLEQALELALARNPELEEARLELDAADGRVREAWSNVFPTLDLVSSYTRNLTVPGTFLPRVFVDPNASPDELMAVKFGADNNWALNIRAEQPLFRASAFIGVGASERYRALQQETVRGRAQQIATQVRLAYYDVLLAQEGARLSENAVTRVRRALDDTRAMHRAGLSSSYDVLRLEVELANLEPGVRRSANAVAAAKRQLATTVGLDVRQPLDVVGSLASLELADAAQNDVGNRDLLRFAGFADVGGLTGGLDGAEARPSASAAAAAEDEVVRQALASRSELRQLELMEELREAELRAERSEYLPRVTLFGNYQINAQQSGSPDFFGATPAERAYGRQVGVQVTMPLFAGFARPARVQQKQIAIRQVQTQQQQAAAQVESQVRTLVAQVEEARERADAQRFAVTQARRGHQIATVQYREGLGSQLELTDAELALRQSEFNYAEAVYDYLVARARLDEAAGAVPVARVDGRITLNETGTR